jgi:hypothetical protein
LPSTDKTRHHRPPGLRLAGACALLIGANALHAQSLANTVPLSFGAFTAGSGGTLTVTPVGSRTKTGGVMLVSQGGVATAAQFMISGTPNAMFNITLPADGSVVLSSGSDTMALDGFVAGTPAPMRVLSGGGTHTLSIGATMTVAPMQAPGNYSGTFNLTVNYQ